MMSATIPPIVCTQPDDMAEVKVLDGFRLEVRFKDGLRGEVEMDRLVHSICWRFAQLADPVRFAKAEIAFGTVVRPGDLDLAPDAMYEEIQRCGRWELA